MKGDIMTEKNKKRAMIVGTCVVAGVALFLIGKEMLRRRFHCRHDFYHEQKRRQDT